MYDVLGGFDRKIAVRKYHIAGFEIYKCKDVYYLLDMDTVLASADSFVDALSLLSEKIENELKRKGWESELECYDRIQKRNDWIFRYHFPSLAK